MTIQRIVQGGISLMVGGLAVAAVAGVSPSAVMGDGQTLYVPNPYYDAWHDDGLETQSPVLAVMVPAGHTPSSESVPNPWYDRWHDDGLEYQSPVLQIIR